VKLESGEMVTAHCPNTGAMTGCWQPGAPVQLSASENPKRKLGWTLERIDMGVGWIGVNTSRTNQFINSFIRAGEIKLLSGYDQIKTEPAYCPPGFEKSRFDLLLCRENRRNCYVEVKNTTLFKDGQAQFPDAKTARGRKHLKLLQHAVKSGHRAVILFAVNRPEGDEFAVASDIDPDYHQQLICADRAGVEIIALRIDHTRTGVEAGMVLPVSLGEKSPIPSSL
jgi:sugar fermentation stimulation protein A